MKQTFVRLLESNDIEYQEIGFEDPLIEKFPEIEKMRPVDKPRKRWLIICITTKIKNPNYTVLMLKKALK